MKMKRLIAPKFWRVKKKETKWAVSPRPGPHKKFESIPLVVLLRDILGTVETATEARKIIKSGEVVADGKARRDRKYSVGLMDAVSMPKLGKSYRIVPGKKGLEPVEIPESEANKKICKINNKAILKGESTQLNCHDGRNILIKDKSGKDYKTGDSLLIELPSQKIVEHLKFDKGNVALITKGKNAGMIANIKKISKATVKERAKATFATESGDIDIDKDYVLVVGKAKPLIKVSE